MGLALIIPFVAFLGSLTILPALVPGFNFTVVLFLVTAPLGFLALAGFIFLFAAWITPKGGRPFVDPLRLW